MKSADSNWKCVHTIDEREVTVERYLGREAHARLFLKGKHMVRVTWLDVTMNQCDLYRELENAFANYGRYTEIRLTENKYQNFSGVAEIDFVLLKDAKKAMKIAEEQLHCGASRFKNG
ncbi:putative nucleotide-binding alpha-beta plait domain superfamily, RNA-binding domain superfamily [Helianthus anomalus]